MEGVKTALSEMGIEYNIDTGIVRGLDYYTRTVFEITGPAEPDKDGNEKKLALGGGGRYDGLVKEIGGPALSGIGFAMGISRLITAMKLSEAEFPEKDGVQVYIASLGASAQAKALGIVKTLLDAGIRAESDIVGRSLKAQMKYADKIKAKYTLILGDTELESGKANLRNMSDGTQLEIELSNCADVLKNLESK